MNIYKPLPSKGGGEITRLLHKSGNVRIEQILSDYHTTGWYFQDEDEWVCLLKGEADIEFEGFTKTLLEGDSLFIPRHVRHRVSRTTKCLWLCVFIGGKCETK